MERTLTVAAAALSVLALGLATTATGAGTERVKTKVKLTKGGPEGAEGRVTSEKSKCEKKRKVTLYNVSGSGKGMVRIGTDKTDNFGRFEVIAPLTAGEYRAQVAEKDVGDLVCKFAISAAVRF
jgi:hypothetical protein